LSFDLREAVAVLERTPAVLRVLLEGLPEGWTRCDEGPDTWSAFDVVGHLIDGEEHDWLTRARTIVESGRGRPFEPFDRFRHLRENRGRSLEELLDRFEASRTLNLRALEALHVGADELRLEGTHPAFGDVTLQQLLATWVAHDLGHLQQITRVMAKRYREEVGPWAAYLPVLHR
jgi:hypothetical protein